MSVQKMDGRTIAPQMELLELLKEKTPEIFTEGKIDPAKLKQTLGEEVTLDKERYGLNWAGKSDCFRHIQEPTTATLKPCRDESVDFDATENLFIEGDNLQVLKTLQKSYYGKVKMIYIDPPYNTGNDTFIYPDRFQETQDEYLQRIGDKDAEGNMTTDGFWRKNSKDAGHFHSNWLSMMYPRLFLAKNLLRPDGVIFVSIDDNEVHNLQMIMNEIFGEGNFLGIFVINSSPSAIDYGHIAKMHDYALFYCKDIDKVDANQLPEENKVFKYSDEDGPFNLYPLYNGNVAFNPTTRPNLYYPFYLNPNNKIDDDFYEIGLSKKEGWVEVYPVVSKKDSIQRVWRWGKPKAKGQLNKEIIGYKTEDGEYRVVQKTRHTGKVIRSMQTDKAISTRRGTSEIESIFGRKVFTFPKAIELIRRFIVVGSKSDSVILDFFAGACTTAHAIMQLNAEDGGNRKFICVQLPEECDKDSEAYKAGYKTIAEIGKERIRRAAKKIKKENEGKLDFDGGKLDLGFKVFKLDGSNFKIWRSDVQNSKQLEKQLSLFVDNVNPDAQQENILYELILKSGLDLNVKVEAKKASGKQYFVIEDGKLILCLEEKITEKLVEKILAEKPEKVICLDRAFSGNDQLKTNTALQMEAGKIEFKVI